MSHYHTIITAATGITDTAMLKRIEDCMRQDIFHSTLDWQSARQLRVGARTAVDLLDAMDAYENRVSHYEAQGMTRSDAQGVVDAEYLKRHGGSHAT